MTPPGSLPMAYAHTLLYIIVLGRFIWGTAVYSFGKCDWFHVTWCMFTVQWLNSAGTAFRNRMCVWRSTT